LNILLNLGTAFTNVESDTLHPMIGVGHNVCVEVNFGQKQFMFDIDQYAQVGLSLSLHFILDILLKFVQFYLFF